MRRNKYFWCLSSVLLWWDRKKELRSSVRERVGRGLLFDRRSGGFKLQGYRDSHSYRAASCHHGNSMDSQGEWQRDSVLIWISRCGTVNTTSERFRANKGNMLACPCHLKGHNLRETDCQTKATPSSQEQFDSKLQVGKTSSGGQVMWSSVIALEQGSSTKMWRDI